MVDRKVEFGVVKFFNSNDTKMFGFIIPDTGGKEVFLHFNNGKDMNPPGWVDWFNIESHAPRFPHAGDRLVFERVTVSKGPKAFVWGFETDYKSVVVKSAARRWNEFPGLEELVEVIGGIYGLVHCIPNASRMLGLSNGQIRIFVRNTPGGKKGEELWREFTCRRDSSPDPDYNFCTFMREVLAEAGHPYSGPAA